MPAGDGEEVKERLPTEDGLDVLPVHVEYLHRRLSYALAAGVEDLLVELPHEVDGLEDELLRELVEARRGRSELDGDLEEPDDGLLGERARREQGELGNDREALVELRPECREPVKVDRSDGDQEIPAEANDLFLFHRGAKLLAFPCRCKDERPPHILKRLIRQLRALAKYVPDLALLNDLEVVLQLAAEADHGVVAVVQRQELGEPPDEPRDGPVAPGPAMGCRKDDARL